MLANKLNGRMGETENSMFNRSLSRTQILKRDLLHRLEQEDSPDESSSSTPSSGASPFRSILNQLVAFFTAAKTR